MKIFAIILALAATIVSAAPAADEGTTLVTRDANCDFCLERYNFCLQAGCKQTCVEHVCHVYRYQGHECKDCGGDFDKCREKSRYA
ncbi:uncharacterized protein J4E84_002683 [Alternaria hordeiaustralica]|uniref:uncharacterized protein n=1 Tax=Alternaria viburni TaxID=566460 RepID=UPI0020C2B3C5|nr:uncharacterized protein J4E79_004333 [Alternaria viburni]XP_049247327.1 uncharacterized protein J4E84_002683 [Alternaria hordeiaustralica]KAI4663021.1 hypothetical protein J4E79_004333 [Alternaria viburni]KAI4694103.1 hypothetical protein J4E84_002683 [Alternaria hordeiaustralica]